MTVKFIGIGVRKLLYTAVLSTTIMCSIASAQGTQKLNVGGVQGTGGSIKGIVKLTGDKIPRAKIEGSGNSTLLTELVVPGDGETLQNVLVYVNSQTRPKTGSILVNPTLDQRAGQFIPHVMGVVVGQEMSFATDDGPLLLIVRGRNNNPQFSGQAGYPTKGKPIKMKFAKPDILQAKVETSPWMSAYVHVMENPFFAVTQKDGTFEIKGLPAGEYEVKVWHEELSSKGKYTLKAEQDSLKVTVADGKAVDANFTYVALKKEEPPVKSGR